MATLKNTIIDSVSAAQLPVGTTEQRPTSPLNGFMRFNTTENKVEYYSNGDWIFIPFDFVQDLNYTWYETSSYFSANNHPVNESQLNNFFNPALSGVNFGGTGIFSGSVNWGDSNQTGAGGTVLPKPIYLPADGFSWMVEGYIYAPETGTYAFGCDGDDAIDVHVNNVNVASWYGGHGFNGAWTGGSGQVSGSTTLAGGNYYTFRARMEEGGGGDGIQVGWKKPSDGNISLILSTSFFRTF